MSLWLSAAAGLLLGLSLAAPPGPMNAIIARESTRHGALAGVRVGLGAPVADVLWLLLFWFGLGALLDHSWLIRLLAAGGAGLMGFFSYTTLRSDGQDNAPEARPATFLAGFAMAVTNPYQAAWWFSGGFVFLQREGLPGVSGLVAGIFVWVLAFAWLVSHGAQRWAWFRPAIRFASAALLGLFAVLLALVAAGVLGT